MEKEIAGFKAIVIRKNIKNIYLSVLSDGSIKISAPKRVSMKSIEELVNSKRGWIVSKQQEILLRPQKPVHEYKNGETVYLFGEKFILDISEEKRKAACLDGKIFLAVKNASDADSRKSALNEFYRASLKERVSIYLPQLEKMTGLYSSSWQIKNMKTRWGTCNTYTGKIWLNLQLAKAPEACLKYVILHELTHLAVSNHGPQFQAMLDRFMPDWREVKRKLNEEYVYMQ